MNGDLIKENAVVTVTALYLKTSVPEVLQLLVEITLSQLP